MVHRNAPLTEIGRLRLARVAGRGTLPGSHTTSPARRPPRSRRKCCACGVNTASVRCDWRSGAASRRPPHPPKTRPAAGEPVRHYERARPGELVHIDVKKLGRLACTEDLPDETAPTCTGFLARATAHFASPGIPVEHVLTHNA
ncbi:hypothetical protein GCM10017750_00120 [Streptomyces racemochromogenes]